MSAEYRIHYDCMDNKSGQWEEVLKDMEGGSVIGVGGTAEQAEADARQKLKNRDDILGLTPMARLHYLVTKKPSDKCCQTMTITEMEVAIRMIAKIILKDE